jgi:hypothetical protein
MVRDEAEALNIAVPTVGWLLADDPRIMFNT